MIGIKGSPILVARGARNVNWHNIRGLSGSSVTIWRQCIIETVGGQGRGRGPIFSKGGQGRRRGSIKGWGVVFLSTSSGSTTGTAPTGTVVTWILKTKQLSLFIKQVFVSVGWFMWYTYYIVCLIVCLLGGQVSNLNNSHPQYFWVRVSPSKSEPIFV